jgi:hypothetical protein
MRQTHAAAQTVRTAELSRPSGVHGTASITLGPLERRTTIHVSAESTGYAPGAATVRIRLR